MRYERSDCEWIAIKPMPGFAWVPRHAACITEMPDTSFGGLCISRRPQ